MSRLTLRLPNTLHRRLAETADREGVSLNQYLVYLLARGSASPYVARPVPADEVREQGERYGELLGELGSATHAEILAVLEEREPVAPESGLTLETVERIRARRKRPEAG